MYYEIKPTKKETRDANESKLSQFLVNYRQSNTSKSIIKTKEFHIEFLASKMAEIDFLDINVVIIIFIPSVVEFNCIYTKKTFFVTVDLRYTFFVKVT